MHLRRVLLPLLAVAVLARLLLAALDSSPSVPDRNARARRPITCPDFWVKTPGDRPGTVTLEGRPFLDAAAFDASAPMGPDPWIQDEPAEAATSPAPTGKRYGPLPSARPDAAEGVLVTDVEWTDAPTDGGFELAAYDLTLLSPITGAWMPALRGLGDETGFSAEAAGPWWSALARALVGAVGHGKWADPALLAWDARRSTLYVRQDAEGHARVAEELVRQAEGRLGTMRLDVWFAGAEGENPPTLSVDVPWGPAVRSHRGTAWAYLADYEVECGMGGFYVAGPCVLTVDTGFGVSARRVLDADGSESLQVEVAAASGRPEIERHVTSSPTRYPDIPFEVASVDAASWRGRISAHCGQCRIRLPDGRRATLIVHEEQHAKIAASRFPRRVLSPELERHRAAPPGSNARVVWMPPRATGASTLEVPLSGCRESPHGVRIHGQITVDAAGKEVDPSERSCPWPLAEGGAIIRLRVHETGSMDVVDLVFERCADVIETRTTPCDFQTGYHPRPSKIEPLTLHAGPVRVDSRRVLVPHGETVTVHLDDDPGGTLRIAVPRKE